MAARSKYKAEYHVDWAWSLALKGATNDEIAAAFGISTRTFIRWCNDHDELKKAVDEGKNIADAKIEKCLYQRATGYSITDTEKVIDMDKDGNPKPVRIRNTTKNIPPDVMAIMYWLNNRQRDAWTQNKSSDKESNKKMLDAWFDSIPEDEADE